MLSTSPMRHDGQGPALLAVLPVLGAAPPLLPPPPPLSSPPPQAATRQGEHRQQRRQGCQGLAHPVPFIGSRADLPLGRVRRGPHRPPPRGFSASCRPSPSRLNASTVSSRAAPGKNMYHHAESKIVRRVGEHRAPARGRWLNADAEERERRLEEDVRGDDQRAVDDDRRHEVGEDLAEDDPPVRRPQRARRLDELLLAYRQDLAADDARDVGPADERDREDHDAQARLDQCRPGSRCPASTPRRGRARAAGSGTPAARRSGARCSMSTAPRK